MSSLVITISSTMGLDAIIYGRNLLLAGKAFYANFSGVKQFQSYEDLAQELNNSSNYITRDNMSKIKRELFRFARSSYPGDPQPSQHLFSKDNLSSIIRAIENEMK
jgi:capsule polysaccharide modification protein KpsS